MDDGDIPLPNYIGKNREKIMSQYNTSAHIKKTSSKEEWWNSLESTLIILDKVAPHVSDWVKEQKLKDNIIYETEFNGTYARYDVIDDSLIINISVMSVSDGRKAAVLAHEWRHSRQSYAKWGMSVIACMILGRKEESILEDDACFYESKVLLAFYP